MMHAGDVIREAEYRKRELEREVALYPAGASRSGALSEPKSSLRDRYYRQLGSVGRRMCAQGLSLGCTIESHALDRLPTAVT